MEELSGKHRIWLFYIAITLITFLAFENVRNCGFVYDDVGYVVENLNVNTGLNKENVIWAFTKTISYWHPLTWISHMIDCQLFGINARSHHITSLLLHVINAMLLFSLLRRLSSEHWTCFFIAAAFAVHPLRVESVAWIAERKDVLGALFYLLTVKAYLRYVRKPNLTGYIFTILIFTLGLMAKPILITLPCVLFVMDIWPLKRCEIIKFDSFAFEKQTYKKTNITHLIMEKIPFCVLSMVLVGLWRASIGEIVSLEAVPFKLRFANAMVSFFAYIEKMIFPVNLAPFYPYPKTIPIWQSLAAFVFLILITAVLLKIARKKPYLCFGWLWYLITLIPVIGLLQEGTWPAIADRFTYLPSIGFFIMIAFFAADITRRHRHLIIVLKILTVLTLLAMMASTWIYVMHWQNDITLYGRAIKVTKNNYIMHNNFGQALVEKGFLEEGKKHFEKALFIKPDHLSTINNISIVFLKQGKFDNAIAGFDRVMKGNIAYPEEVYCNLANAYAKKGDTERAVNYFNEAINIKPDYPIAINNLGMALKKQGKIDQAIIKWQKVLDIEPGFHLAHFNLGTAFAELKEFDSAIRYLQAAIKSNPSRPKPYDKLAEIFATNPEAQLRNGPRAVTLAEKACELTAFKDPGKMDTLAAAYAQAGDFDKAIRFAQKAIDLAIAENNQDLARQITSRRKLYKTSQPYRTNH